MANSRKPPQILTSIFCKQKQTMISCEPHQFNCSENEATLLQTYHNLFKPNVQTGCLDEVRVGWQTYQINVFVEDIQEISRELRKNWFQLQNVLLDNSSAPLSGSLAASRSYITEGLHAIALCLLLCDNPKLKLLYIASVKEEIHTFSTAVLSLTQLESELIIKLSSSALSNVTSPHYQYFHGFLDVQFYLIALEFICEEPSTESFRRVIGDLLVLCRRNYERNEGVFQCRCVRNLWRFIEMAAGVVQSRQLEKACLFWDLVNTMLQDESPQFVIWLLNDLSSVTTYTNYSLLETKLKLFLLSSDTNPQTLQKTFQHIHPLICVKWLPTASVVPYEIIWDYYSKHLNPLEPPECASAQTIHAILRRILTEGDLDLDGDFECFLRMLMCHLRRHPTHWSRMKGRIFSQLSPQKTKLLLGVGVVRVIMLFMALVAGNLDDSIVRKFVGLMENLPKEKRNCARVWNALTAFMLNQLSHNQSIELVAPLMATWLQDALNDNNYHLPKEFLNNFELLLANPNIQLHQWLLLDQWLYKYLAKCSIDELSKAVKIIEMVLIKLTNNLDSWLLWKNTFLDLVYPCIKQLTLTSSVDGLGLGRIIARICRLSPALLTEVFTFFSCDTISPATSWEFTSTILEDGFVLSTNQEALAVQMWLRMILLSDKTVSSQQIVKLDLFPVDLKQLLLNHQQGAFYTLVEYLGDLQVQSDSVGRLCDVIFGRLDRFVGLYLEEGAGQNQAVVLQVYTAIAMAFVHCGMLLYHRNRGTCPLTRLIATILLPTDLLMGKPPEQFVLDSIQKTWHLYFEALVALNHYQDAFLERTLRNMIIYYLPHFPTVNSPMVKCLAHPRTARVLLNKLSNAYFIQPTKAPEEHVMKALKIVGDFIEAPNLTSELYKLVIATVLSGLFHVVMFHPLKHVGTGVVQGIFARSSFYREAKDDVRKIVEETTEKHLGLSTGVYFQLMGVLARCIPGDLKGWLGYVREQMCNVERKRGVGYDNGLRLQLEKLERILN